jgi:two-component system LytT family response regulator
MKLNTLIIDDEKQARNSLRSDLSKYEYAITILGEADSVETAVKLINEKKPDLVFLDINLGDGSGFNVLEKTEFKNFKTIFVTAYDQYAIKAFKVSALDFLLKPVDLDELEEAINKAKSLITPNTSEDQIKVFREIKGNNSEKKIVLKELDAVHIVKVNDLIACEASGIYTTFYINNNKQIVVSKNLKEYEEILEPYDFLRVHNSFLINANKIEKFEKNDGGFLIMEGGQRVPVSQRKKDVVINFLKNF